jgi:hypothetical protein
LSTGGVSNVNYIAGWKEEKIILAARGFGFLYTEFFYCYKIIKKFASDNIRKLITSFIDKALIKIDLK